MDNRPIGVFDSGLGGLTVLKEIRRILPDEDIIYFGDCGRAPYGVKSPETIRRYTFQNISFFLDIDVKLLVIACNTSSAYTFNEVSGMLSLPVIEVIRPGSAAAAKSTRNGRIGVIGTSATIASRIYDDIIMSIDPEIKVCSKACPLFVPLVEEGPFWWTHDSARLIADEYLRDFRDAGIDVLVLGCTHYPLLSEIIGGAIGAGITLISSARAVASEVYDTVGALGIGKPAGAGKPNLQFYTSDSPEKFEPLCAAILGEYAGNVRVSGLDIDKYESRLP